MKQAMPYDIALFLLTKQCTAVFPVISNSFLNQISGALKILCKTIHTQIFDSTAVNQPSVDGYFILLQIFFALKTKRFSIHTQTLKA
jgi:hypothetical protein